MCSQSPLLMEEVRETEKFSGEKKKLQSFNVFTCEGGGYPKNIALVVRSYLAHRYISLFSGI